MSSVSVCVSPSQIGDKLVAGVLKTERSNDASINYLGIREYIFFIPTGLYSRCHYCYPDFDWFTFMSPPKLWQAF